MYMYMVSGCRVVWFWTDAYIRISVIVEAPPLSAAATAPTASRALRTSSTVRVRLGLGLGRVNPMSATTVPSVRKPVECGAADMALYVRLGHLCHPPAHPPSPPSAA